MKRHYWPEDGQIICGSLIAASEGSTSSKSLVTCPDCVRILSLAVSLADRSARMVDRSDSVETRFGKVRRCNKCGDDFRDLDDNQRYCVGCRKRG